MSSISVRHMAHNLHVWLMNEMQYDASGADGYHTMPTPENLSELFCGQLPGVWKYLMENIYGIHSIHTVKGNLQLSQGTTGKKTMSTSEETSLRSRKETLTENLRQTTSSIQHLDGEIAKLEKEIIRKGAAVRERCESVRREQRLTTLHQLHSAHCQLETRRVSQLAAQLGQASATGEPSLSADDDPDMQATCVRQIEVAAAQLAGHIDGWLEQTPSADSLADAERAIGCTVRWRSPADILRSFAGLQQRAGLQLAQHLQHSETVSSSNRAAHPEHRDEVMLKIQQSIDELHALHVTWRVTETMAASDVRELRRELDDLTVQLHTQPDCPPVFVAAHLEAADLCGRTAAMEMVLRQLTTEVAALDESRAALDQRYKDILRNQEIMDTNQSHIQLLVAQGRDSLVLTRADQQRAAAAAQLQLAPLLTALLAAHRQLADDVTREAEAATRRVLQDVRWVCMEGVPVVAAGLPLIRPAASESVLLARRLRSEEEQLLALLAAARGRQLAAARVQALAQLRDAAGHSGCHSAQLEDSRRRVESQMEHERTTLMPQLEKLFVNMSQIGAALKHARTALQHWTDQPARAACVQVQHAGLTLKQWEQRYLAATASVRAQKGDKPARSRRPQVC